MSKMSAAHLDEQENPTWGNKTSYRNPVFQKDIMNIWQICLKKYYHI